MSAKVRPEITYLLIQSPDHRRSWELRAGDEVPQAALEYYSNPRAIDFGDES